ncbi:hypothetical protein KY312_00280 [Candidatus Woesearchaeota archaeon]|nr:hypothetical protein [Candidatus Woesearchaeota archaeon]
MKKILFLLLVLLLFASCAKQDISPEELQTKRVILSEHKLVLEPLEKHDFFVGLNNEFSKDTTFFVSAVCRTNNCDQNIIVQTFPQFSVGANKKGAFPIRVEVLENSRKGNYTIKILVKENNSTYDSDEFTVEVAKTIEEIKQSALGKLFR